MGLDDFKKGSGTQGSDGSSSQTSGSRSYNAVNWSTKLDFSKPYVVVAEDKSGEIRYSKGNMKVIETADDWKRLEEFDEMKAEPPNKVRVIFERSTYEDWLRFCNLCIDQDLGDPDEVLEENPERLAEMDDKVYYPPGRKPATGRSCQLCGKTDEDKDAVLLQMRLQTNRKFYACASHTVEELAQEGLLQ